MKTLFLKSLNYLLITGLIFCFACSSGMKKENNSEPTRQDGGIVEQEEVSASESEKQDEDRAPSKSKKTAPSSSGSSSKTVRPPKDDFSQELSIIASEDTAFLDIYSKGKKLVKTADLKFKVENVEHATYEIEKITRKYNGFIVNSDITSSKSLFTAIPVSSDSLKEVFSFYTQSYITIRLPFYHLDSALADFADLFVFLDYRKVRADDVTTTFLRNKFRAMNKVEFNQRVKKVIDERGGRIYDVVDAEQKVLTNADRMIEDKIANYTLQDRVNFSTIVLNIYQNSEIFEQVVADNSINKYQPSIGMRFAQAFKRGWILLLNLFIGISHLWSLILIGIVVYIGVRFIIKRYKKNK